MANARRRDPESVRADQPSCVSQLAGRPPVDERRRLINRHEHMKFADHVEHGVIGGWIMTAPPRTV